MAARALASATISFGLVSIPVKLYSSAETGHAIRFNQIHKKDGARVKQQLVSSTTGEPVPKDEIAKGYEFAKGQYVLFTPEELKALEAKATQTIDITEFVPAGTVERMYLNKVYFLGPDKGGARAYRLLSEALKETCRAAIAKYAARGRQHVVLVRPIEDGLLLEQLHYHDELRGFEDIPVEEADVKKEELQLATQLVEQAATDSFDPAQYRDEVRERMMELIQKKVDGEDISMAPADEPEHKIIDIMEALKASLSEEERKPAKQAKKKTKKKPAAKKRARK